MDSGETHESGSSGLGRLPSGVVWFLDGYIDDTRTLRRVPIETLPFLVGRGPDVTLALEGTNVSRRHAEIFFFDGKPMVRDLGSRNGTFVNYQRIGVPAALKAGDVIHFSGSEFRLGYTPQRPGRSGDTESFMGALPRHLDIDTQKFLEILNEGAVRPLFQKIVRLSDGSALGCEILSRGSLLSYYTMPVDLFRVAGRLGLEQPLSRVLREKGVEAAARHPDLPLLFINTHPSELHEPESLVAALAATRAAHPNLPIAVEIPESLVTNFRRMHSLRHALREHQIRLAYDDFGTGQARLVELAEVPPDFLKFDITLVQGLHAANTARRQMVRMLVKFCADMGIETIAEGVETAEEADAVRHAGFDAAQGYYFARPVAAEDFNASAGEPGPEDTGA